MIRALDSLLDKLAILEREIAAQKGEFSLFGLFHREESISWDLIFAAPWIAGDRHAARDFLVERLQARLDLPELRELGRIQPLMEDSPFVAMARTLPRVDHGRLALGAFDTATQDFRGGYLITNRLPDREPRGRSASPLGAGASGAVG